jgi:hypothetical protein
MGTVTRLYRKGIKSLPGIPRLADLAGKRPRGHPKLERTERGRVLLALGQVWVERHSSELWVIREMVIQPNGKARVYLSRYGSRAVVYDYGEANFRSNMAVWEQAVAEGQALVAKVRQMIEDGAGQGFGHTPKNVSRVLSEFFGIDPVTGERID